MQYQSLRDLSPESLDITVKARIIRSWRGISSQGEGFKGLNVLLLDDKKERMHAFVPSSIIDQHENKLREGSICTFSNFTVKLYNTNERFRCINSDRQIVLTTNSEIQKLEDEDPLIPKNLFDFCEISELPGLANSNVFLKDVIGVIWKDLPLAELTNRFGKQQHKVKLIIVDGRFDVNVTFWDALAHEFVYAKKQATEFPIIIIIASAKITSWQGSMNKEEHIEVANATATKFYLNYPDPRVVHIRKMLGTPMFSKYDFSGQILEKIEQLTVDQIKKLGTSHIKKEVVCNVQASLVREQCDWFYWACTSCHQECKTVEGNHECYGCNDRTVPRPEKKWRFHIEAEDDSGFITIEIFDREARTILGITPYEIDIVPGNATKFPSILKTLEKKFYSVKLLIQSDNVANKTSVYAATDIFEINQSTQTEEMNDISHSHETQQSMTQASASSYHLDDLSQMNFTTPTPETKKRIRKPKIRSY